jgi:hypothetical protein
VDGGQDGPFKIEPTAQQARLETLPATVGDLSPNTAIESMKARGASDNTAQILGNDFAIVDNQGDRSLTALNHSPEASQPSLANPVLLSHKDEIVFSFRNMLESPQWRQLDIAEQERRTQFSNLKPHPPDVANTGDMFANYLSYYANDPDAISRLDSYMDAQQNKQLIADKIDDIQVKLLNENLNAFLKQQGLPAVRIELSDDLGGAQATYVGGAGLIKLDSRQLNRPASWLINHVTHEATHFEQDNLLIRRAADQLDIGASATPEQMQAVALKLISKQPDMDFIAAALEARAGKPLSPDEQARADSLHEAHMSKAGEKAENDMAKFALLELPDLIKLMEDAPASDAHEDLNCMTANSQDNDFFKFLVNRPEIQSLIVTQPYGADGLLMPGSPESNQKLHEDLVLAMSAVNKNLIADSGRQRQIYLDFPWEQEARSVGDSFAAALEQLRRKTN